MSVNEEAARKAFVEIQYHAAYAMTQHERGDPDGELYEIMLEIVETASGALRRHFDLLSEPQSEGQK